MSNERQHQVAVIGAGPAGLMAAEILSASGAAVTVYDRMASPGRKLLMAGRGGLNLTHSEPFETFVTRYGAASQRLQPILEAFPPAALVDWAEGLGEQTFTGSSGRIFPRAMKASPLLRAWLRRLGEQGVVLRSRHDWLGWNDKGALAFRGPDGPVTVEPEATVLALGGASWPKLGSDGRWSGPLAAQGVGIEPFQPSNCGFIADWSSLFRARFGGTPLKGIAVRFEGQSARGDAVVTEYGIEAGAVYALSAALRDAIARDGKAVLEIDLRPDMTRSKLADKLSRPPKGQSLATFLRKTAHLPPVAVNLLREAGDLPAGGALAALIKSVPVTLTATQPMERAISTAGGVSLDAVDNDLMLSALPGVFAAGEMLDWEAPTGGYLLQADFATGRAAALGVLDWLANRTG